MAVENKKCLDGKEYSPDEFKKIIDDQIKNLQKVRQDLTEETKQSDEFTTIVNDHHDIVRQRKLDNETIRMVNNHHRK